MNTDQYRRLDRALSRVFWGLLFTMLLLIKVVQIPLFSNVAFPVAALPMLYVLWGLWELRGESTPMAAWPKLLKTAVIVGAASIYFIPFVEWWQGNLGSYFLAANALFASVTFLIFLVLLNLIPAELTRLRKDEMARRELVFSAWFAGGMLFFMIGVVVIYALYWLLIGRGLPFKDLSSVAPEWHIRAMLFLPVGLTLISLFKGRIGLRIAGNSNLR